MAKVVQTRIKKKPLKLEKYVKVSLNVPEVILEAFDDKVSKTGLSRSYVIRELMMQYINTAAANK